MRRKNKAEDSGVQVSDLDQQVSGSEVDLPGPRFDAGVSDLAQIACFVDEVDRHGFLRGWACVVGHPTARVEVAVYEGAALLVSGVADQLRRDVSEARGPDSDGYSGFNLPLPEGKLDGQVHRLVVRGDAAEAKPFLLELELELPRGLRQPPKTIDGHHAVVAPPKPGPHDPEPPVPIYVPGQYIVCSLPFPAPPYHTEGWHEPEAEFTWIQGLEASIEMIIRRPKSHYTLNLDVVPNRIGDVLQTLEVFVNFFRVALFEVQRSTIFSVRLPAELFIMRRTRIVLHCRNAVAVAEHGVPDQRQLGVAVRAWCID